MVSMKMAKVVMVLAVFGAALSGMACAKIYTIGNRSMSMPLATVVPADYLANTSDNSKPLSNSSSDGNANTSGNLTTTSYSFSTDRASERDPDDSEDSSDDDSSDSEETTHGTEPAGALVVVNAAFKLGSVLNATSTIEQTYVNWVGNSSHYYSSRACWRKAHIAKTCPLGFDSKLGMCWTQCPYLYPVECGLECIRQNDGCGLEVFYKVAVVVQNAISLSAWSIYGDMTKWAKSIQVAVKCIKYMISITKSLVRYIRYIKIHDPDTSQEQLLAILYQIDNVIIDIPVTISYCIGSKVSDDVKFADMVLTTAEYALKEIIYSGDIILSSWSSFTKFMKKIALGESVSSLKGTDITSLKSALKSNTTCGYDLKRLLDRTWMTVAELRSLNPDISEDDIRVIMSQSNLMLNDIPIATNNCMNELLEQSDESTAYDTRETLRKTFVAIADDLISAGTSNNGTFLNFGEYAFKIADRAIAFWSIWDPFYISSVISEFVQPICGPTQLIGEIDDGNVKKALGLSIVQGAFNNSDGTWKKVGDGTVTITFKSVDTEDVRVNIKSGGDKVAEVPVPAGKTVVWKSNVTALGGKTLYLDRWRPGFLGLPGTGGGSLLLWIPRSTHGGSLELTAMLNVS
ncbi:hypothetical protein PI124_g1443 [Phytophthora idaei]|nr:hypothetical protein PI125_g926 [Phytophthora idaei]KAG3173773.1 hypothetical protein PI126_g683 [Phytophthora idaei]KAG3254009.1 hypothetical protein PI124_g1443 [Phytophthora idaei]